MRPARSAPRGQAAVELALGMLVFITVLVFGIHFAEVSYLSMKVQHAAAFAVYDATGERSHEATGSTGNPLKYFSGIPGQATSKAHKFFKDFKPLEGADHATKPITHVFTRVSDLRVRCTKEDTFKFDPSGPVPGPFDGSKGGMKCGAEAEIALFQFPKRFFDGQWNLKEKHYAAEKDRYKVCATPRATNGACGEFGLLTGDFSLQGAKESKSHDLQSGGNDYFRAIAQKAWGFSSCPTSMALSLWTAVFARPDACLFAFSYQGVEKNYRQDIGSVHSGATRWLTGGTNGKRTANRNNKAYLVVKR